MNDRNYEQIAYEESGSSRNRPSKINIKETVSHKLRQAAEEIKQGINSTNEANHFSRYSLYAGSLLNRSADYIESLNLTQLNRDIQNEVRRSPGHCLLIAGAVGLLFGVLLRRR